jgi:hypothetical protein
MGRPGLSTHRKFRRLSRALGSHLVARGVLETMWDACYESGEEYVGTASDVEALIGWTGEPGMVTRALVEAGLPEGRGFLEPLPGAATTDAVTYRVHDLWHHAPEYVAKRRRRELERQQKEAPFQERRQSAPNGGQRLEFPNCQIESDDTPAPSPSPAPSPAQKNVCAEPPAASAPPPPLLVFPIVGKGAKEWALTGHAVAEWTQDFPGLDVLRECRAALAWTKANPEKRKTARGMPAFLVRWLTRSNDRGGSKPAQTEKPRPAYEWVCEHTPKCSAPGKCDIRRRIEAGKVAS